MGPTTAVAKVGRVAPNAVAAGSVAARAMGDRPVFIAGKSMGARVCARATGDDAVAGMIALGYPLHPPGKPQVKDPPEWPMLVKPALFVQGDRDPFCSLERLLGELPRLPEPHQLVVIAGAGHSLESKGETRDTFPEVRDAVFRWIQARSQ